MSSDDLQRDAQDRYAAMMERRARQTLLSLVLLIVATLALVIILFLAR